MFVERKGGVIVSAFACEQPFAREELPDNHPEVVAFMAKIRTSARDTPDVVEMVRALVKSDQAKIAEFKGKLEAADAKP